MRETMETLRWAIVGAGRFGAVHAEVLRQMPGVELAAVSLPTQERAESAAKEMGAGRAFGDYRRLLEAEDIDVVTIATHWKEHFPVAMAALESGKHVLLEKPMAATADECRKLIEAARRATGIFMVGHICRFDPRAALAKQAIDEGRIGRIISMHAKRNLAVAAGFLRLDKISALIGDGVHDADLMMWFLGRTPSRIYARTVRVDETVYPDVGWAMLEFGDLSDDAASRREGALGIVESNWRLPKNAPTTIDAVMQVIGTEGQITIDCGHAGLEILDRGGAHFPDTAYWPVVHDARVGALRHELDYFASCVREGRRPEVVTPEEAARALMVMETAERSAKEGIPLEYHDSF
jgi:UDP-N-acetylglucosamine 3-dehydrogenase